MRFLDQSLFPLAKSWILLTRAAGGNHFNAAILTFHRFGRFPCNTRILEWCLLTYLPYPIQLITYCPGFDAVGFFVAV
ncbi:hypothetical protein D3C75_1124640 [compost metagenome]